MSDLQDSVKVLMNSNVISVLPGTKVLIAIDIILTNKFNGIPVTDKDSILVGILTKYDLIIKRGWIQDDTVVGDVMNKEPLFLSDNMTVDDAIRAFSEHHKVDPIPVVDEGKKLVGIITRSDMVKLFREYGIAPSPSARPAPISKNVNTGGAFKWLAVVLILGIGAYYLYINFGNLFSF